MKKESDQSQGNLPTRREALQVMGVAKLVAFRAFYACAASGMGCESA